MVLTKSAKRIVAGIASAFLLLCQSLAVAQACVPAPTVAGESALILPCHDAAPQSGDSTEQDVHQANCPAQYVSVSLAKLDIPAAADAPGLAAPLSQPVLLMRESPFVAKLPAHAEPPPLCIVHYCLRN